MPYSPPDPFSPAISYQEAMGKMRYILPLLMLLVAGLGLPDRSWDRQLFVWINTGIPHVLPGSLLPLWDAAMNILTYLGDTHVMLWVIFLVALQQWMAAGNKNREKLALYLAVFAIVLVLATALTQGLKEIVGALRPAGVLPIESLHILGETLRYRSFPSGHTVTAFAAMCSLLPIIPAAWRWGALALAAGIGFSRIGVGAHWPIDVAAGALLGIVAGMMSWRIALWLQHKKHAENTFWKKIYQGLAMLGLFILAANVAYTPFYDPEHLSIRLGLIGLGLTSVLLLSYRRRGRPE